MRIVPRYAATGINRYGADAAIGKIARRGRGLFEEVGAWRKVFYAGDAFLVRGKRDGRCARCKKVIRRGALPVRDDRKGARTRRDGQLAYDLAIGEHAVRAGVQGCGRECIERFIVPETEELEVGMAVFTYGDFGVDGILRSGFAIRRL